jgi:hypothetical protein
VVDDTVEGEATHWGDVLLNCISLAHGVVVNTSVGTGTKTIDLLVDFGTGVITLLTSTGDSPFDCSWMPSSNTCDLSETSVSLSGKFGNTKSLNYSGSSFTSCNCDGINHFVVLENFSD